MEGETKKNLSQYQIWQPLLLSAMVTVGMVIGYKMNDREDIPLISNIGQESSLGVGRVEEVIRFIESRYVDELDTEPIIDKAILAAMDELDPHSIFLSKDQMSKVNEEMGGAYRGIGIETFYINDTVNIIMPVKDGPAEIGGMKSFDQLIKINDSLVAGNDLAFREIREMLRGAIGEELTLGVLSNGEKELKNLTVKIDDLPYTSVGTYYMVKDDIALIKIDRFSQQTYEEFMEAIEFLGEKEGARHLIIDLRDNPGGVLPEATEILSQLFLQKGNMLVYTQGKNDRQNEYKSTGKPFFNIDKLAILIDENSASGSEILAGAIQDWDRGVVIGRRSFGKGLVQDQYNLSDGSALRLTVARYYTPVGRSIQKDYTDLNDYGHDIQHRYDDGELFNQDSIQYLDSLRFKTKILGRSIYGGGGISPDIFIPLDSSEVMVSYQDMMASIPRFAYDYLRNNKVDFPENVEDYIKDFQLPTSVKKAFSSRLDEKGSESNVQAYKDKEEEANRYIKYQMGRIQYGRHKVDALLGQDDPFIEKAIEFIEGNKGLQDL